jgi:hypothetical protein
VKANTRAPGDDMSGYTVSYMDKRGAGCQHGFSNYEDTETFVRKLKREATVRLGGEVVGGVEDAPHLFDDKRFRWWWWMYGPDHPNDPANRQPAEAEARADTDAGEGAKEKE